MSERGCFRVYRDTENPQDIHFEQIKLAEGESVPESQLELRDEVDQALTNLRLLFADGEERFEEYFRSLLALAQLGLVGNSANPKLAMRALASLKNEVLASEGGRVKNQYMKKLGFVSLLLGVPALLIASIVSSCFPDYSQMSGFLYLWGGCMAGVWLSFGARKVIPSFDDLAILEKDRLNPAIRLIFAGLLTITVGLIVSTNTVVLELGGLKASNFITDVKVALLVGVFCGLSEQALSTRVVQHASDFFGLK